MPRPVDKEAIVRAVNNERTRTLALLRRLEPAQWETPTALPGWRVREIVAHLLTTDQASVTGTILPQVVRSLDALERWNDRQVQKWRDRPVPDLLGGLERWGRRFLRFIKGAPAPLFRVPVPTMWGRHPAGLLAWSRAYDEWVHRQDIRRALDQPDEDVDLAPIVEFLMRAGEAVAATKADGSGRFQIDLHGTPLPSWTVDLDAGTIELTAGAAGAEAVLEAKAPPFIMAAAGRGSFKELEDAGDLTVKGARGGVDAFLNKLRVV